MSNQTQLSLEELAELAVQTFEKVNSQESLEKARIEFLGDKSQLKREQKKMSTLSKEERPIFGKKLNEVRQKIESTFKTVKATIEATELNKKLNSEAIDITLPGIPPVTPGAFHPLTLITKEIVEIFQRLGFSVSDGPEIETEYYNFTALNTPEDHPARDEQDTFYTNIAPNVLLRSQTSPVQVHSLEKYGVPLRVIAHGRVYRNEEVNARKMPFFHQLEILCVEEGITFANLKWTLQYFLNELFGEEIPIRLRPDFFPFTEPSAEVDAQCVFCKGKGCSTCGGKGWLELLGCGMVDPNVLEMAKVDTTKYSGFAAGLGLERLAMLKYGISDIRNFFTSDIRFLEQFRGAL
ncbi:MAG: phenylalanine--tRNA ligase subunit alpha [Candidatus Caenarcaniphilales bacterium]|nr:phenylalanine--tRNA ligase subunit alpha [Candidatus Caenarcaniphilales bacterium]